MIKGFVCSAFDLGPHAGHLAMLKEAKDNCDFLVVGLHIDPSLERSAKSKPVQSAFERYQALRACKFIDEIIPYETEQDLYNLICIIKPDIRFLGSDYTGSSFTGDGLSPKIYFCERKHSISSSQIRRNILKQNNFAEVVALEPISQDEKDIA